LVAEVAIRIGLGAYLSLSVKIAGWLIAYRRVYIKYSSDFKFIFKDTNRADEKAVVYYCIFLIWQLLFYQPAIPFYQVYTPGWID
jgi:hypothetical protein